MGGVETGYNDLDPEPGKPSGLQCLLRRDANFQTSGGELASLQIFGGIETDAGADRNQQKLGRRHALVSAAVVPRLVADDAMSSRTRFEFHVPEVLNSDFHKGLHQERCGCRANVTNR